MTLAAGLRDLDRQAWYMFGQAKEEVGAESPVRIHGPEPDYGHDRSMGRPLTLHPPSFGHGTQARGDRDSLHDGLGAPEYHPSFLSYLRDSGVCIDCEPDAHRYPCGTLRAHYRKSQNRSHPRRLKRAFRQLRDIDPPAYDITWLIVARHMSWRGAVERINGSRYERGQDPYSDVDMATFTISGMSLLAAAF